MNNRMQAAMAEATRLTQAGRLTEATAVIQRALRGEPDNQPLASEPGSSAGPARANVRIVEEFPPSLKTPVRDTNISNKAPIKHSHVTIDPAPSPDALRLPDWMSHPNKRMHPMTPGVGSSSAYAGGQFIDKVFQNSAGSRPYKLYIPTCYTGQALPLIVMLHGCTQTPLDFAVGTRMNQFAESGKFLVAYPGQVSSANSSGCWNWFQAANQQRGTGEPAHIAGITQQIMHTYHIDASRVYVAGLSSGGAMAAIMAATYPDLYAAVGVHSGLAYGAAHNLPSALAAMKQGTPLHARRVTTFVPMIVFHGDRDTTVDRGNADRIVHQWLLAADEGAGTAGKATRDVIVEPGQVTNGHAYTRSIYQGSGGRTLVEKWIIHQTNHAWSGGGPGGSYTDPKGPDASAELARFFSEHPRI